MKNAPESGPALAYLIAGAGGMLGTALQRVVAAGGATLCAPPAADFDITDPVAVRHRVVEFAEKLAPDERGVLVNAAAYTNVERAEDEPGRAYLVNEHGPALLARAARAAGLGFAHVSTDFVFDGRKEGPYSETDEPNPLSVYGATKLAGEIAVTAEYPEALIVRTAWLFGRGGANFPAKILEAASTHPSVRVVTDEIGSPTYALDLASGITGLVMHGASGLFHLTGSGWCTRYELAEETLLLAEIDTSIEPVTSGTFPTRAMRPRNSVLDCAKAARLGVVLPEWRDALARYVREIR